MSPMDEPWTHAYIPHAAGDGKAAAMDEQAAQGIGPQGDPPIGAAPSDAYLFGPPLAAGIVTGHEDGFRWDDPGPDEMMPDCGHEVADAAGTYDTGAGPAPGRGCDR